MIANPVDHFNGVRFIVVCCLPRPAHGRGRAVVVSFLILRYNPGFSMPDPVIGDAIDGNLPGELGVGSTTEGSMVALWRGGQ